MILSADKNSAYYNETDPKAGYLWGDAAAAFFISKERVSEKDSEIVEVYTQGLGYLGKAPDAVHLRPCDGGIMMPEGRDVFIQACTYMPKNVALSLGKEWLYVGQPDIFHRPSSQYAYHVQYCQTAQSAGREIPA